MLVRVGAAILVALTLAAAAAGSDAERRSSAWLGVVLGDAVDGGVRVLAVIPGGPAELAGLRNGDLLIRVRDVAATDRSTVSRVLRSVEAGQTVVVRILRDGTVIEQTIDTAKRPSADTRVAPPVFVLPKDLRVETYLGGRLVEMSAELRRHYRAPEDAGLLVAAVEPEAPGARAGLAVGDVLVRACGVAVTRARDSNPCLGVDAEQAVLQVIRDARELQLKVDPPGRYARTPRAAPEAATATEIRIRLIEDEIERLQARLAELREELARLK